MIERVAAEGTVYLSDLGIAEYFYATTMGLKVLVDTHKKAAQTPIPGDDGLPSVRERRDDTAGVFRSGDEDRGLGSQGQISINVELLDRVGVSRARVFGSYDDIYYLVQD